MSKQTAALSSTHHPLGTHGLWGNKRLQRGMIMVPGGCWNTPRTCRTLLGQESDVSERTCSWAPCGARFNPKRCDQRTCSAECRVRLNRLEQNAKHYVVHEPRACIVCSTVFTPRRSDSATCSIPCRTKSYYNHTPKRYDRTCECGKTFTATRSDKVRCSTHCNKTAHYEANRADRIAAAVAWNTANAEARSVISRHYKHTRRAREMGQAPAFVSLRDWQRLVNRHGGRCAYCKQLPDGGGLQLDHVVPLSRGGSHGIGNIAPACGPCNMSKSNRLLIEWRLHRDRRGGADHVVSQVA